MIALPPALAAVAAAGLPGAPGLARHGWDERLDAVVAQGLSGLLASAAAAGRVHIDGATAERLQHQLEAEAIRAVQLEGELLRLAPILDELRAVVLKGAVLAHGAYPDPLLRPFTDLDLLVSSRRFPDAVDALTAAGYRRSRPEPAPGYDSHVGKALTLTHPGGVVVDLHRTLAAGRPGAAVDVEELLDGRILVAVGDQWVRAPSWEAHLVECALHAVVGDGLGRGLSIRDVAQVAQLPDLDADAAVDLARRWRVSEHVAAALHCAELDLGASLPAPLTALSWESEGTVPASAPERSARSRLDELAHGDLRRRAILTRALLAPSPAFLRWTYGALPLPQLYGRRWRTLYQRSVNAGPAALEERAPAASGEATNMPLPAVETTAADHQAPPDTTEVQPEALPIPLETTATDSATPAATVEEPRPVEVSPEEVPNEEAPAPPVEVVASPAAEPTASEPTPIAAAPIEPAAPLAGTPHAPPPPPEDWWAGGPDSEAATGSVGPATPTTPAAPLEDAPTAVPPDTSPAVAEPDARPDPPRPRRRPRPRSAPQPVVAGAPDRRNAGGGRQARWTAARPPRRAGTNPEEGGSQAPPAHDDGGGGPPPPARTNHTPAVGGTPVTPPAGTGPARTGVPWALAGAFVLVATAIAVQLGLDDVGVASVPLAAVLLAVAAARHIARVRPDEAWVGRWLVLGVFAKLTASYLRYLTLTVGYEGVGDATGYDGFGRQFAAAWLGGGTAPELPDLRRTNFIRWFTGVVYYLFGSNMVTGFFVFGLLAVIGSYLWFRATATAVPGLNKKLYLALVVFAPSIAFWPSSIGKEALMQLGIGTVALGAAHLLRQRLVIGLLVGVAGGWVLWVVRPHLLALVTVAAGCAYVTGRVRAGSRGTAGLLGRPIGVLVVVLLMAFTVSQGAEFLGIEDLSLSSIEAELDEQTERSAQGGSQFDNGDNSLNPLNLPRGAVTVLLRPFPWETDTPLQLLASLESVLLAALILARLSSVREALARARTTPFLLYAWVLTILYAATFSSFANFGLLVRQRSLVLPALFVLLAVEPLRQRRAPVPAAAVMAERLHAVR